MIALQGYPFYFSCIVVIVNVVSLASDVGFSQRNISLIKKCEAWFLETVRNDTPGDGIGPLSLDEEQLDLLNMVPILASCRLFVATGFIFGITVVIYIAYCYQNSAYQACNKMQKLFFILQFCMLVLLLILVIMTGFRVNPTYEAIASGIKQAVEVGALVDGLERQMSCKFLTIAAKTNDDCLFAIRDTLEGSNFFRIYAAGLLISLVWQFLTCCCFKNSFTMAKNESMPTVLSLYPQQIRPFEKEQGSTEGRILLEISSSVRTPMPRADRLTAKSDLTDGISFEIRKMLPSNMR